LHRIEFLVKQVRYIYFPPFFRDHYLIGMKGGSGGVYGILMFFEIYYNIRVFNYLTCYANKKLVLTDVAGLNPDFRKPFL
jgi:hypothetical protein